MQPMNTVMVGCGAISAKHAAAIRDNEALFRLVGAHDINPDRAERVAADTGCRAYTDLERMAAECRPEVAAIATPSSFHAEQAVFWLERGAHVVLEKPVALSTDDIGRIRDAQLRTGRKIVVAYVMRYAPHIRLLARAVEQGRFGRIFHVGLSVYWNRNDEYYTAAPWRGTWAQDGGAFMNQATHGIDFLQWLLGGRPDGVKPALSRSVRPIEAEDFGSAIVTFENGGIGTIQATVNTYPTNLGTRLTILGETGTVEISGKGPDEITVWKLAPADGWEEIDAAVAAGQVPGDPGLLSGHSGVYQDLARAIADGAEPLANLRTASVSAEIVLGIYEAHRCGGSARFPVSISTTDMVGTTV